MYIKRYIASFLIICSGIIYSTQQPTPLPNVKTTCYLNSILQCIYNLEDWRNLLINSFPQPPHYANASLVPPILHILHSMHTAPPQQTPANDLFYQTCNNISQQFGGGFEDATSLFQEFWRQLNDQYLASARKDSIISQSTYAKLRSMLNGFEYTLYDTELNISQSEMFFDVGSLSPDEENPNEDIVQLVQKIFTGEELKVTHVPDAYMLVYFNLPREKPFNMSTTITLTKPKHAKLESDIPYLPHENAYRQITYSLNSIAVFLSAHYVAYVQRNGTWWRCDDTKIHKLTQLPTRWAPSSPHPADQQARISQTNHPAQQPREEPKLLFYEVTEREHDTEYMQNLLYSMYHTLSQLHAHTKI